MFSEIIEGIRRIIASAFIVLFEEIAKIFKNKKNHTDHHPKH